MDKPFYNFTIENEALRFEFLSIGNTIVRKIVLYEYTDVENMYNLTLSDFVSEGLSTIHTVTNNGDLPKVLATVVQTLFLFFDKYPLAFVVFSGNSPSRNRLYRIVINQYFVNSDLPFDILGLYDAGIEPFKTNIDSEGFFISPKTNKLAL
jgi:hypothetical protein